MSKKGFRLDASTRFICDILASIAIIVLGIFLLLVGLSVISLRLSDVALPAVLLTIGLILFCTALLQRNSVALWFSAIAIVPAIIILLVTYFEELTYSNMYPFFVGMPSIASLLTVFMSEQRLNHLRLATFFGALAIILGLNGLGLLGLQTVIPLLVLLIGIVALFYTLKKLVK